jgi:hypothetical protein
MAIDNLAVTPRKYRDFEPKLTYRRAHAVHGGIVFAGVPGVENQSVYLPEFNLVRQVELPPWPVSRKT